METQKKFDAQIARVWSNKAQNCPFSIKYYFVLEKSVGKGKNVEKRQWCSGPCELKEGGRRVNGGEGTVKEGNNINGRSWWEGDDVSFENSTRFSREGAEGQRQERPGGVWVRVGWGELNAELGLAEFRGGMADFDTFDTADDDAEYAEKI